VTSGFLVTSGKGRERPALALPEPSPILDSAASAPSPAAPEAHPTLAHDGLPSEFADPFVLTGDGSYFAYATGEGDVNVQVVRSPDLTAWTRLPDALPKLPSWASREPGLTWAPAVLRRPSGYVMYYTTRHTASGFQCIGRATSSRPEGPYVDTSTTPFICPVGGETPFCGAIDPSPFVDDDGHVWLLWKSDENSAACRHATRIWAEPLDSAGVERTGQPTALVAVDRPWEGPLVEGPSMIRDGGAYYLFYSANDYESASYAVGYAVCASPIGPCKKASSDGPLMHSHGLQLGPGGQEAFRDATGASWIAYHAWTAPRTTYAGGGARSLRFARLRFSDGAPRFDEDIAKDIAALTPHRENATAQAQK
jgi:beta-xylosidase